MKSLQKSIVDKIDDLNQLAWDSRVSDPEKSLAWSRESLQLQADVDYPSGKANALKCQGFALLRLSNNEEAQQSLDEAISIFQEENDVTGIAICSEYLGIIQRNLGNYSESLSFITKAIALSTQTGYLEGQATSSYHAGVTHKYLGNYVMALDFFHKCLSLTRSAIQQNAFKNPRLLEAYTINIIGAIYFEIEDYAEALAYYQQGLLIRQQSHDKIGEAGSLDNIGATFIKLNEWEKATEYCLQSLSISESINDKRGQGNSLYHLAKIHKEKKEFQQADVFSSRSMSIRQEIGDRKGEAELLLFLADLKMAGDVKTGEVKSLLNKALTLSNEIDAADLSGKAHWALYQNYKSELDYAPALYHLEQYDAVEKQLHKAAVNEKVLNFQISTKAEHAAKETEKFKQKNEELAILNTQLQHQKEATEKALARLKETQSQLIQSEKMASLGELTAGIAHEIQNPLNFVNNFSDINKDLIEELKSHINSNRVKADDEIVSELLSNIQANETRINEHGRRADSIVKSMMQHSRQSPEARQSTDLNALCNEYLKLSYYGFRAKDKNFTAELKTSFDESIKEVNIVPQDIGRVLLNLFNNAFYACAERSRGTTIEKRTVLEHSGYEPLVSVTTRKINEKAEIRVADNGSGIPDSVKEKIFQPFFTTKPAGRGTGLGLSLSYDIIRAHGGEIKVDSKEDEGSTFIIHLFAG